MPGVDGTRVTEALLFADAATLSTAHALGVPAFAPAGIRKALEPGQALSAAVDSKGGLAATARALADIANANTGGRGWLGSPRRAKVVTR